MVAMVVATAMVATAMVAMVAATAMVATAMVAMVAVTAMVAMVAARAMVATAMVAMATMVAMARSAMAAKEEAPMTTTVTVATLVLLAAIEIAHALKASTTLLPAPANFHLADWWLHQLWAARQTPCTMFSGVSCRQLLQLTRMGCAAANARAYGKLGVHSTERLPPTAKAAGSVREFAFNLNCPSTWHIRSQVQAFLSCSCIVGTMNLDTTHS
eukprot:4699978-Pleurochrysis_carterae.AAC.2